MDPSLLANIERLLCDLYGLNDNKSSTDQQLNPNKFNESNKLLIDLQRSKEAWHFCWLLMDRQKPVNVQYFGTSSLYLKLTKYHFELDNNPETYRQIWQKIIENIIDYMQHPDFNLITSKLISCLAVCIVQNIENAWNTAIEDVVNLFQPEKLPHIPTTRVIQVLLEILSIIPDEFNNPYNDKNTKNIICPLLVKHAESILLLVYKVLQEENISDNITKICMKCFSNWCVGFELLTICEQHSNIVSLVLNCCRNENTCNEAVECLVAIYTSYKISKQTKLVISLIEQMTVSLSDVIQKAFNDSNHDYLKVLYFLFISIGESHTRIILDSLADLTLNSEIMIEFFKIILKCSSTPTYYGYDETISDMPFNFWIVFQDDLMASDESKIQVYLNIFKEIFHSMINIYLFKLQYPPDEIYEQAWDKDDREKFRCYRQDIADTFAYCFTILNSSFLEILMDHFNKAMTQTIISVSSAQPDLNMMLPAIRYLEAVIYAFSALTESISITENIFMPQILSSFQTLPTVCLNEPRLCSTINGFLSESAEWLAQNIDYIAFTLAIISNSLKSADLLVIISATMALKVITSECQLDLKAYAPQIVSLCEEYLQYPNLQYKEKARLMYSLGTVLSIMPLEVIMQTIDRILIPILTETEKILCVDNNNDPDAKIHINGVLLMLSNLFAKLDVNLKGTELEDGDQMISKTLVMAKAKNNQPQPLYKIFEKVLPMFGIIAVNYAYDEDIAQNLCDCVRKTVITLLDDIKPLVANIFQLLLHLYHNFKSVSVIKISQQLFILFHKEPELLPGLQEYFYSITKVTIETFEKDFRESTYLVQNYYEESAQTLRKAPIMFLYPKLDLMQIFEWAIAGILLPEKATVHQCSIFISEFLSQGRSNEHLHKVIDERFEMLVMKVFIVIGGTQGSPSFAVDYMPDIIMALNQKYSDSFTRTLNAIVECNGFPTEMVNKCQKMKFVKSISLLRNNKRKLKEVVKEFSQRCRGLFGVDNKS